MEIEDCKPFHLDEFSNLHFDGRGKEKRREACRLWLARLSQSVQANKLCLPIGGRSIEPEPIVYTDAFGTWWVGRYIGSLEFEGHSLTIEPRLGIDFVSNQLPLNKFAQVNVKGKHVAGMSMLHYLQALMWINLFAKAARHCLPTVKTLNLEESRVVRGKLDVRRTVRLRASGSDKVASSDERKTLLNPVSILIAHAFRHIQQWFPQQDLLHWLPSTLALRLQQVITAVGRNEPLPTPKELRSVRFTSLTRDYKPLVALSQQIIKGRGIQLDQDSDERGQGLLLDVAELWEIFVLKVLQAVFINTAEVKHGTEGTDDYLLKSRMSKQRLGKLLPDYLIGNDDGVKLVADAKYKKLGDAPWMSPKRDDLYQMCAYLTKYAVDMRDSPRGMLIYPEWDDKAAPSSVAANNPWVFDSGAELSFITIPTKYDEAVKYLSAHAWLIPLLSMNNIPMGKAQ